MIVKSSKHASKTFELSFRYSSVPPFYHAKLKQIFQNQLFVMKLSYHTRILPNYFSFRYLTKFKSCSHIDVYWDYVKKKQNLPYDEQTKNTAESEIFKSFPKYKKYIFVLDCYVDWLKKNVLKMNSNEYYKNKFTMETLDIRNPQNWFDSKDRHFIYHHGPTNSGKTSSAIKQLKQLPKDSKGIYMAPLRLLAWQMQQKLQNCNLITGQDKQYRVSNLTSCTIEALNSQESYDVAIIDEIQMIGDPERGWSWTKAILSTNAKRIHLCGDERAIGLVSRLIKKCSGTLQERKYSRLGKLKLIPQIFEINKIQQGDCMIEFSVETLHKLRKKIKEQLERRKQQKQIKRELVETQSSNTNGKPFSKIAMVYGRLPAQCRKQQARKFNSNIAPYLVATNAIGMGLNLNIKKMIFAGIKRRNSKGDQVELEEHQIQQIAGRAGRGLKDGLVQCSSYEILRKVRKALRNVNKTYGINLEVEQPSQELKQLMGDEDDSDVIKSSQLSQQNLQNYDNFLKRRLTQKQCRIEKAGLYIEYIFLRRLMIFMEQNYQKKISVGDSLKMYLNLSLRTQDLYFLQEKAQFMGWINKLQKQFQLEPRDVFEIAKALSMHYNSPYAKEKMEYFASRFSKKMTVNLPKNSIEIRSQKQVKDNIFKLDILQSNYSVIEVYLYLWNKYEFIFWEVRQAKKLKEYTSNLIKSVLEDQEGYISNRINQKTPQSQNLTNQDEKKIESKFTILDQSASGIEHIKI